MHAHCSASLKFVFLSILLVMSAGVRAADPAADPMNSFDVKPWFTPTEPLRIVGPIHYVGTQDLGVYLITTPAGHILLDGAMPSSAALIETSIRKLGYRPEDIRLLLISHAHIDHVGTLAHFKKSTGAKLAVMAPDDALLKSGGKGRLSLRQRAIVPFHAGHGRSRIERW